jgi:DNA-binding transcriptional ArsR family regulator
MHTQADDLARILKVLAVGTRLQIMQVLKGRSLCVGALASHLEVTQGGVSQHLRVMRDAGLVIDEKRGHYVHYRLNERKMASWRGRIDKLLSPCVRVPFHCSERRRTSCREAQLVGKRSRR